MKSNKKGFTLIELIVVMAILVILMAAVFALFKPVSSFHINAADTDKRFTAVNGINDYLEESLKFAKSVYVFSNYKASDFTNSSNIKLKQTGHADEKIHERMLRTAGLDPSDLNDLKKIHVIAVYNKNSSGFKGDKWSDGETYTGRIYKVRGVTSASNYLTGDYEALGPGYYGKYHYEFATKGNVLAIDNTMTLTKSADNKLVFNTKVIDKNNNANKVINAETTAQIPFLNKGKTGAGEFKFFDKKDSATIPTDLISGGNQGDDIIIFYISQ